MTEQLRAAGEGDLSPSEDQMGANTTQQDAASGSVESPKCGSSFTPTVDEAGEEMKVLPEQMQVDVDPEIQKEQRDVMSTSYKCEGDQMGANTTQQDADSGSVESPERRSSGPPAVDQAEEEVEEVQKVQEVPSAGEGDLSPSEDQMGANTTQQAVAVKCPECGFSFTPTVDQAGGVQDAQSAGCSGQKTSSWPWSWSKVKISTPSSQPLRIPPVYTMKVHSVSTGRTCGADDEILEKVKNMKSSTQVKITDYQECDIIIVFCPITSRVGSDVEAAMRQIPAGDKPVILVLMHHTRDVDFSTDVRKWSGTYQNVKLDVHVLFHETQPGLLKCKRNNEAVHQIQIVLKAHSRSRIQWPNSGFNVGM